MKLLNLALGILLPPVGIFMTYGVSSTLFINIGLTLLGWIPGSIHAVWAIAKQDQNLNQTKPDEPVYK
jgi:uncharacterized membrane protein YqaE (UPF0057 family)